MTAYSNIHYYCYSPFKFSWMKEIYFYVFFLYVLQNLWTYSLVRRTKIEHAFSVNWSLWTIFMSTRAYSRIKSFRRRLISKYLRLLYNDIFGTISLLKNNHLKRIYILRLVITRDWKFYHSTRIIVYKSINLDRFYYKKFNLLKIQIHI